MDAALLRATFEAFLTMLRQGHPSTPVVVVSPTMRPDAEDTPNRLGATLRDLREVIETSAQALVVADPRLHLLPGGGLLDPTHLADGVHPNDAGHELLAAAIGQYIATALQSDASPT